ncbi:hypothetical protein BaRGS_00030449 [Batillaria attramentaria]|uniref:Uncharacterized protein n=1 Tax=Batillaria attramentaria TaxID=370345 RepID=A0ABD0JTD6_9CAEN
MHSGMKCMPDNKTINACFRELDELQAQEEPDTVVVGLDDVTLGNETSFDSEKYTVEQFEMHPMFMCKHREAFIASIRCMDAAMKRKCPFMPKEFFESTDRLDGATKYACSELPITDDDSLTKGDNGGPTDGGKGGYSMGGADAEEDENESMWDEEETEIEQDCRWGESKDDDDSSDVEKGMDILERMLCYFKYRMLKCARKSTAACDEHTADVMVTFMKKMASPKCARMMDECGGLGSQCAGETCGAADNSVAWTAVLLPALLVMNYVLNAE